jgi:hypothetical protein
MLGVAMKAQPRRLPPIIALPVRRGRRRPGHGHWPSFAFGVVVGVALAGIVWLVT